MLKRKIVFLGKSEYFTGTGIKGKLTAAFMRGVGTIPVDRTGGVGSNPSLEAGKRILADGDLFGIYPEGTRSHDGRLYRGKTGVARLAIESGAPVIPVAMIGTDKVQPIGKIIPHVYRVGIIFGEPLDFSKYAGMSTDRKVLRTVTDEIMYELMCLSGQEYVDVYGGTARVRQEAGRVVDEDPGWGAPGDRKPPEGLEPVNPEDPGTPVD